MRFINVLKEPKIISFDFVEAQIGVIADLCRENNLALLYVHGSLAKNRLRKLSDIDIAVLKRSGKLSLTDYSNILEGLQNIFGREDIDLADLAAVPALLRMRVLQGGKLIYSSDFETLARFRYKTFAEYLETSPLRRSFSLYLRKAYGVA